jgi:hypothetical protein
VFTKIMQIVHGGLCSAPFSGLELNKQNSASRPGMWCCSWFGKAGSRR